MNPWLFTFLVSLALLLLTGRKQMIKHLYGGILSAFFIQAESILATSLGLFEYNLVPLNLPDIFLFSDTLNIFLTGVSFNTGIIIASFHPRKMGFQLLHALAWTIFLICFNCLGAGFNLIYYHRFKPYFVIRQFLLFLFLAWVKNNFVLKNTVQSGE